MNDICTQDVQGWHQQWLDETLVIPMFTYDSECWKLRKSDERKICAAKVGWLRRLLGVSRIQRLQNDLIRSKLGQEETLCARIQKKRLRWFGPWKEWMTTGYHTELYINCYIEGKVSRGRQRKMWVHNVKEDLVKKNLNIRTATELARDRTRWRTLMQTHRQLS